MRQHHICKNISWYFFILMSLAAQAGGSQPPPVMLANTYSENTNTTSIDFNDYWVSEKLDGVRAYWDGKHLLSRQGNIYHAPAWFVEGLPSYHLDGELWIGRAGFDELSGIVRRRHPDDGWKKVQYRVFDLPQDPEVFDRRLVQLRAIVDQLGLPWVKIVKQFKVSDEAMLMAKLNVVVEAGGEGLMLHRGGSLYRGIRSVDLLKLKQYQDAEARVIAQLPGKGKYLGMMGSLLVETPEEIRFRIGTGFSDQQRKTPPAIGMVITYKYYGTTGKGIPRFASFLREREPLP